MCTHRANVNEHYCINTYIYKRNFAHIGMSVGYVGMYLSYMYKYMAKYALHNNICIICCTLVPVRI